MGLLERVSGWLGGGGRGGVPATVLVLGLDGGGKSAVLRALRPPPARQHAPPPPPAAASVQPSQEHFTSGGVSFTAWDVCGAARHRALWERHYRAAHAVIFVVDSTDHLRLVVAREELELMLAHPDMSARRAPLLVLANKCDAPLALAPHQIAAALCLERVTDRPWHICATSARAADASHAADGGLAAGVAWLARQLRDALVAHNK